MHACVVDPCVIPSITAKGSQACVAAMNINRVRQRGIIALPLVAITVEFI